LTYVNAKLRAGHIKKTEGRTSRVGAHANLPRHHDLCSVCRRCRIQSTAEHGATSHGCARCTGVEILHAPTPPNVASPNTVETQLGTLRFLQRFARHEKLHDNLDFQRAVQGYLLAPPVVNQVANRTGILAIGPANTTLPIWAQMVDARTVELTGQQQQAPIGSFGSICATAR
jgi:hypothetical protein